MRLPSRMRWWCTADTSSSDGNRREVRSGVAIGEHDDAHALVDRRRRFRPHAIERLAQRRAAAGDAVEAGDHARGELRPVAVVVDVDELRQFVVVEDREGQRDLVAGVGLRVQQVALGADRGRERRDELLANRVERRVRDLREQLREVVEQQPRAESDSTATGVSVPIDPTASIPSLGHRRHEQLQLFVRVSERHLAPHDGLVRIDDVLPVGQVAEMDEPLLAPLLVRVLGGELGLDLFVVRRCGPGTCRRGTSCPGCSRPFLTTRAGSISTTPDSLAMITRLSSVTQ